MSEYQYYEFQAIDRPLTASDQEALRAVSTRAQITATSFTNHYNFGGFKGDPRRLMERWFDLHLYLANWGTRCLMMRVPRRYLEPLDLQPFLSEVDWVEAWTHGDDTIIDLTQHDEDGWDDDWDEGSGWLAALAPLRADVISGDLRLFYLAWLTAVEDDLLPDDALEPLPGIGPLTGALDAFASFFRLDPDLVAAAAERSAEAALSADAVRQGIASIPEADKTDLLVRVVEGDPHVAADLKARLREQSGEPTAPRRMVADLRARADAIRHEREQAEAARQAEAQRRRAEEAEKARRARLDVLRRRGTAVWRDIEGDIEQRNASGYDRAAQTLADLKTLADEQGTAADFARRLADLHERHARKRTFLDRLRDLG
ncbi:hypothetical protein [uncultured Rhodospira sp.]|uniref:hypothetical protein n=1 Tax=uncultured Rhodospira sp. TaxID=1936189 RepID=UPI00261DC0EA|nr:hypothetical protein [uncultured Rhodospira sp.]